MKIITEYLSNKVVKPSIIRAEDKTIRDIVLSEVHRLGYNADLNHIDTSKVTTFYYETHPLFPEKFCGDVSKWDVGNCITFTGTFYKCKNFNGYLNDWDMRMAESVASMFRGCENFNQPLDKWQFERLDNAFCMFGDCFEFNQDLSKWNMRTVTIVNRMFENCFSFHQDLSSWELKGVNMIDMFAHCRKMKKTLMPKAYLDYLKISEKYK